MTRTSATMDPSGLASDGIDQLLAKGVGDQFAGGVRAGLGHHVGPVPVHGLDADAQRVGHLAVGAPGDDEVEDLALAIGQRRPVAAVFQEGEITGADNPCALEDGGDGPGEFGKIVRFAEDPVCADIDQLGDLAAGRDAGEDDDFGIGRPAAGFEQDFGAARVRHGDIEQQQGRAVLPDGDDGLDPVRRFGNDIDRETASPGGFAKRGGKSAANDRVVIGNHRRIALSEAHAKTPLAVRRGFHRIEKRMTGKPRPGRWLAALLALLGLAIVFAAPAAAANVVIEPGRSAEQVESQAEFLVLPKGTEISVEAALAAYRNGDFGPDMEIANDGALQDWRTWVALPFRASETGDAEALRRVIGLGGIFVELPRVYLACDGEPIREILASESREGGALRARYFTYVRTQSFPIRPGQSCLALINAASNDYPNIGIFREGELGSNQVVAVLLKAGFTVTLLLIGIVLIIVSYLTNRPLTMMMGITYFIVMVQNEASLFSTTFSASAAQGRAIWETLTLLAVFSCYWTFLFGFRRELGIETNRARRLLAIAVPLPLVLIAWNSDSTPDIIWSFYLALFLFALVVALRFDVAPRLRWTAGAILFASAAAAVLVEPYYLGRFLTDLTVEYARDAVRMFAGLGMLSLVLVDVVRGRREHERLTQERIAALEAQAESNRKLFEAERDYARAREAATRRKAQLASASHDIRQPIAGLKSALAAEARNLTPEFAAQADQVVAYLERLTVEYSPLDEHESHGPGAAGEAYAIDIVLRAVEAMFEAETEARGIAFAVGQSERETEVPALALIRATSNLVGNALQHAGADRIEVEVREEPGLVIIVRDNGRGMSADALSRSLERGQKGEDSAGDGLGLAIVRELSEQHGFGFSISSREGEGTEAELRLGD